MGASREPDGMTIPVEYQALMERLEWLEDLRDSKAFAEKLARGEEEAIPVPRSNPASARAR